MATIPDGDPTGSSEERINRIKDYMGRQDYRFWTSSCPVNPFVIKADGYSQGNDNIDIIMTIFLKDKCSCTRAQYHVTMDRQNTILFIKELFRSG